MRDDQSIPRFARLYWFSWQLLLRIYSLVNACFAGFWLGVLNRELLHAVDRRYYDSTRMYHTETFNRRGFWDWEEAQIDKYFSGCGSLLVAGVGGGREVLAFRQLGYEVDGFEYHPDLARVANTLLEQNGYSPNIRPAPRDRCPANNRQYDGIIIGWSVYTLIQGRPQRVAFLGRLREQTPERAPILLSFHCRSESERRYRVVAAIGNVIRKIRRGERLELGDDLAPNFVHRFTRDELAAELQSGGFRLEFYSTRGTGHAVGVACEPSYPTGRPQPMNGYTRPPQFEPQGQ
jgi:hypothetical protein